MHALTLFVDIFVSICVLAAVVWGLIAFACRGKDSLR